MHRLLDIDYPWPDRQLPGYSIQKQSWVTFVLVFRLLVLVGRIAVFDKGESVALPRLGLTVLLQGGGLEMQLWTYSFSLSISIGPLFLSSCHLKIDHLN